MSDNFDPDNAVAVNESAQGASPVPQSGFDIDGAKSVETSKGGQTDWESFKSSTPVNAPGEENIGQDIGKDGLAPQKAAKGTQDANKEPLKGISKAGKPYTEVIGPERPPENWLNAGMHLAEGATWNTFVKPFSNPQPDMDEYLSDLEKKHPIAAVVGGTAPFIASAAFIPESLVPNVYARVSAQFGLVGLGAGIQAAREDKDKSIAKQAGDVAGEIIKQAAFGPVFAKAQALKILDRPFATALARAGVITSGSTVMSTMFGNNLVEAFKQGGLYGALSLITESPHLARTTLGRGIINHTNSIYADLSVKAGLPQTKIDIDANLNPEATDELTMKKYHVREISDLLSASEGPQTIKTEEGYARLGSGWPSFLSDKGYDRKELNTIFDKFTSDEKLTEGQQAKLDQILKDAEPFTKGLTPFQKQIHTVTTALANQVPGIHEPQIIAATIKLADGTEIHGASHEDALEKIGHTKETMKELPEVSLERGTDSRGATNFIRNKEGKKVGDVYFSKEKMAEEGIDISVNEQRKGYATAAIQKVFDSGVDTIHGDVGKVNLQAQKFWKSIGGKLNETSSGNFKLIMSKEDFLNKVKPYKSGFTVQNPDGSTKFITREESMKAPFNLPTGHSAEVPGLNESKWMDHKEPEIVNPDTLKWIENNEGKVDVGMLPGVPETAEILSKSHAELKEKFLPYTIGKEGQYTAEVIRENLGVMARNYDKLEASLSDAHRIFEKANKDSSLDFIYKMEEGGAQQSKDLQKIADVLRSMLDTKRDEIRALGTGKLENFIENYFPHVWEDPNKVGKVIGRIMGKRPFQGPASFLKKRTIPTTREGVELGLTPVSYNPIDSVMLKVREMDRYLMAHKSIQALKEQGLIKFVRTGDKSPEGFVPIDDRFAQVTYKNDSKELVMAGKYMAQKDAGRILNNYLSPGLRGKSYIYDMYRGAGNTLNQFQLGLSAFHLGFTSMDATISKFALGINKLSTGDYAGAIKEFSKAPFAPITNIMQGRELLQAWYGKDMGELTNTIADLMASGGGRAKMDKFYATGARDSMQKSLKEGKLLTASLKVPFYIVDQVARPIMEYIVPRQKMGVFMDMMKLEIERNPDISHEQLRGIAQKAWDSVDNRMGQLVYDNLFWHRTTKDLAMASVRSLGWNLGTIREIGGGVKDVMGNVQDMIHGKAPQVSYRTAYVMALPIVTGLYGAIYQYLHTGQGPQEVKDYFFPKNGAIDNKGQPARISLPTYMKDIYHYTQNPVQTVLNKFSPVNNAVMEMMLNRDFYGTQIRNADDPIMQQIFDEVKFAGGQFEPFGFRNLGKDTRTSAGSKVEPFIGITPAPFDVNMTKAEREAYEIEKGKIPVGSRTKEQAKHSQDKAKLRNDFMASKDQAPLDKAVEEGTITSKERKTIIKDAGLSRLERITKHLTFDEVNHLLKFATKEERPELERILEKKRAGKESRGTWTQAEEDMYAKSFNVKE